MPIEVNECVEQAEERILMHVIRSAFRESHKMDLEEGPWRPSTMDLPIYGLSISQSIINAAAAAETFNTNTSKSSLV